MLRLTKSFPYTWAVLEREKSIDEIKGDILKLNYQWTNFDNCPQLLHLKYRSTGEKSAGAKF